MFLTELLLKTLFARALISERLKTKQRKLSCLHLSQKVPYSSFTNNMDYDELEFEFALFLAGDVAFHFFTLLHHVS